MELNLSEIIKNDGSEQDFRGQIDIEPVKYMGLTVSFDGGVEVCGSVKNIDGVMELTADVSGKLQSNCARCMKPVEEAFCVKMEETLAQEGTQAAENEDVIVFSGYSVPLDEIVLNSILISMPVRYLCREDCKGLCPTCGKDLNEGDCGCKREEIDPRLEVLSRFYDK